MPLTVQNVYGLLLRSRLLPPNDAKALYDRWLKEAKDGAGDVERFRRWLVGHHYLTDYQANLLCKGHADGFFISEYKILERLGRGRMAGVYKAMHSTGQQVAVKVLPPSKAKVPYLLSRFERESRLATQLKHGNVVRTFHFGQADGLYFIVMEHLEGETLDDVLTRRRRLPPNEAARIIYQVFQGLAHIQDRGMVHRDLKPSNIMLTPARAPGQPDHTLNTVVKVLDIGLGRLYFDESMPAVEKEEQLTGEGVLLGTPDYLAPEQARNARGVDIRADIYSLGCVLYHCVSGQVPFPDTNILNQIIRHSQETPPPLKQFNPDVTDAFQQAVNLLMAKDANQRPATPQEAAKVLLPFITVPVEPPKLTEDGAMGQYLQWVESRANGSAVPVARGVAPPPKASPTSKSSHSGKSKNRHSKHGGSRWRKKKKRQKEAAVSSVPGGDTGGDFDVELMPVETPAKKKSSRGGTHQPVQGRRDWLLLALGAAGVLTAVGIGGAIAYFTRGGNNSPEDTDKK
ncbi:MAG: serine/threonine protein kinase [Planctomycetia bacterium]|nr:serine/threonine protein kinase [Planctomycetia bacterium]